jgi:hypothetical protein
MSDLKIAATARNEEMSSSSQEEFHTFAQYQAAAKAKAQKIEALRKEGILPPSYDSYSSDSDSDGSDSDYYGSDSDDSEDSNKEGTAEFVYSDPNKKGTVSLKSGGKCFRLHCSEDGDDYYGGDNNGLHFAPACPPANDGVEKCFSPTNIKECEHDILTIALNEVGNFVMFPSRWWHRGFYMIASEKEYYTAQLFCTSNEDGDSWANNTRSKNIDLTGGSIGKERQIVQPLSRDVQLNWDTTYSAANFKPCKMFGGEKICHKTNRHLQDGTFREIENMNKLVMYFEDQYKMVRVKSVWLIKKNRTNDGFQRWHRDFYLSTKIVTTIVVNVGVFDIVWSDDSSDDSTSSS